MTQLCKFSLGALLFWVDFLNGFKRALDQVNLAYKGLSVKVLSFYPSLIHLSLKVAWHAIIGLNWMFSVYCPYMKCRYKVFYRCSLHCYWNPILVNGIPMCLHMRFLNLLRNWCWLSVFIQIVMGLVLTQKTFLIFFCENSAEKPSWNKSAELSPRSRPSIDFYLCYGQREFGLVTHQSLLA